MSDSVLVTTRLDGFPLKSRGKVRDVYDVGENLLIVATDRISAFDVVLKNGIPDKGKVLNLLSLFWFEKTAALVRNHVLTGDVDAYPEALRRFRDQLHQRSMLVRKLEPVPFECVVRGYLYGSGWKDYQKTGCVCGIPLPKGMRLAEKFEQALFTPATKAASGHDENVSEEVMASRLGKALTERLRDVSLRLYEFGRREAESKGIIIADTKFEFGLDSLDSLDSLDRKSRELYLIDEVLTPDSSRFWPMEAYAPGRDQPSYDKQFVREYLETLEWDKSPPGPELPPDVVEGTRDRFLQAYRVLTGGSEL